MPSLPGATPSLAPSLLVVPAACSLSSPVSFPHAPRPLHARAHPSRIPLHRRDSPTSLEDSHSDSGVDAASVNSVESDSTHKDLPTQVATPPHSPVRSLFGDSSALPPPRPSSSTTSASSLLPLEHSSSSCSSTQFMSGSRSESVSKGSSSASVPWPPPQDNTLSNNFPPGHPMATSSSAIFSPSWSTRSSAPMRTGQSGQDRQGGQQGRGPSRSALHTMRLHERMPIVLAPEVEAKVSMQMIDLFEDLLPTEESHQRRTLLIKKIEHILLQEWPGHDIRAQPFGSTVNDLGTSSSDVDICITTTWPGLNNVQMLANAFRKHGMEKVFCVPRAKVPIVKLWDPELKLSCDMNINTSLGLLNTKMIKTYVAIDPRVRPFAMIIKHWARKRVLNDAANGGTISTYTWICIVINFLQMRSPPILPALHTMDHPLSPDNKVINGNNTSFCDDLARLEGFGLANKETLGGLLYAFFRRFAIEFDYDHHVISIREGGYLTKESKGWNILGKHYKLFCVEEPFDTSRNLGNSSDMASSKGLKKEFTRALEILHNRGSLDQVCEQWAFPSSYYHSNNNHHFSHGLMISNNLGSGRRYVNTIYRTHHSYYDDHEDEDEDEGLSTPTKGLSQDSPEASSWPNTRSSHCGDNSRRSSRSNSIPRSGYSTTSTSSRRSSGPNHYQGQPGATRSSHGMNTPPVPVESTTAETPWPNRSQTRSRHRQRANTVDGAAGTPRSAGKQDKVVGSTPSSPLPRRPKSNSTSNGSTVETAKNNGHGPKNTRTTGGQGTRTPRATCELSLADIANTHPKFLASPHDQESLPAIVNRDTVFPPVEDGRKKKGSKRNVVWSTNSSRGDTRGNPLPKICPSANSGTGKSQEGRHS